MRGFLFFAATAMAMMDPAAPLAGKSSLLKDDKDSHSQAIRIEVSAPEPEPQPRSERLDSVVVSASRAGRSTPVTFTSIGKQELARASALSSLPMALSLQPSVVTSNEGGTGLGYSKMTVRGSKGSQINVTLNGITLNDQESQEVFWVNIPSLTSILGSVQLQRGLGTSASGAGAFGASVNLSTSAVETAPGGSIELGLGSWNTMTSSISASSGLLPSGLYFNAAYSKSTTDGYVRNAFAQVQSAFAAIGWMRGSNSLRLTWLFGDQHTGITWLGEPLSKFEAGFYRYNPAGERFDSFGNPQYYDNESDNYRQSHLQLNYTHLFGNSLSWSTTLNRTGGRGFYEQYKAGAETNEYGYGPLVEAIDGTARSEGDFVESKAMDNVYLVLSSTLRYIKDDLSLTAGTYISSYKGLHFGEVLWCDLLGDDYPYGAHWYDNDALKAEKNLFARAEWNPTRSLTAYADLQSRIISLEMSGADEDGASLVHSNGWDFFNPRLGLSYDFSKRQRAYASISLGHREPGRGDLKENIKSSLAQREAGEIDAGIDLREESMLDLEFGWSFDSESLSAGANIYMMEYKDMLLETGKLSSTGYAIKENVPRSYRRGVEFSFSWRPSTALRLEANCTLSSNKLLDYTCWSEEYEADWTYVGQFQEHFDKVDILLSPSHVSMLKVVAKPFASIRPSSSKTTELCVSLKRVGKQFWDNTGCPDRQVPAYTTASLSLGRDLRLGDGILRLSGHVDNILNSRHYSDVWVYRAHFTDGSWYQEEGVFPQAPVNFSFKLSYKF